TRYSRDWSSDVCSSDLGEQPGQLRVDRLGGVASDGPRTGAAVKRCGTSVKQLQMIGELRHGADGGARGPYGVGLIDRDGRRNAQIGRSSCRHRVVDMND